MLNKIWPKDGIFAIPLIREITLILIIKIIVIFTIKHLYFSNPVPFNADHLFGEIKTTSSATYSAGQVSNFNDNSLLNVNTNSAFSGGQ